MADGGYRFADLPPPPGYVGVVRSAAASISRDRMRKSRLAESPQQAGEWHAKDCTGYNRWFVVMGFLLELERMKKNP